MVLNFNERLNNMSESIDHKFSKIDEAIQRLASIASDISKMIAVHEQRIIQQEKIVENVTFNLEKRRDVVDSKFDEVYKSIEYGDECVLKEIQISRTCIVDQYKIQDIKIQALEKKVDSIQKIIWMATGVILLASWIIPILLERFVK